MGGCTPYDFVGLVQPLMVTASLFSLIGHASRGILWLMLVSQSIYFTANASASGTDSLGAVSCESKACSEVGIELLRRGVSLHFPR
jgi:hypothetical protein